jgi:hypothetical protein
MTDEIQDQADVIEMMSVDDSEDLKPKPPPKLAPRGIRTFTVCRQHDETGVSGEGVVVEGVLLASGHCLIHWLISSTSRRYCDIRFLYKILKRSISDHTPLIKL